MPQQVHATPSRTTRPSDEEMEQLAADDTPEASDQTLVDEIDAVLDEIDAVLEANAFDFVKAYIQKGGE